MAKHIIHGAPGTGKTTSLLNILETLFNKGISPQNIAFCTYSRSAAHEAIERAMIKFNFQKSDLPFFGTIHSLCYKRFCLNSKVIRANDVSEFFNEQKIEYELIETDEDFLTSVGECDIEGNIILHFYDQLRLYTSKNIRNFTKESLKNIFYELPINQENYSKLFMNTFEVYNLLLEYEKFKEKNNLIDFIDMLLISYKNGWNVPTEILVVDEFQDLSPLQYEIYHNWSKDKKEVYIAGDSDQNIFSFILSNPKFLFDEVKTLDKKNGDEEIILPKTFRIPSKIQEYCINYIRKNTKGERIDKNVVSLRDNGEIIEDYIYEDLEHVLSYLRQGKKTYILLRTNYYKKLFINEVLIPKGVVYYEIRGKSIWNSKTINLFNASIKLVNKLPLLFEEVRYLIKTIPYKYGLIKRGLKSNLKTLEKTDYTISDLLSIGFNLKLFELDNYSKIYSILDLRENITRAFQQMEKEIISFPVLVWIGTIHSSKGKEAEDIIIFKDVSNKISKEITKSDESWDSEIRVFYTGITRVKERLVMLRGGFKHADTEIIP